MNVISPLSPTINPKIPNCRLIYSCINPVQFPLHKTTRLSPIHDLTSQKSTNPPEAVGVIFRVLNTRSFLPPVYPHVPPSLQSSSLRAYPTDIWGTEVLELGCDACSTRAVLFFDAATLSCLWALLWRDDTRLIGGLAVIRFVWSLFHGRDDGFGWELMMGFSIFTMSDSYIFGMGAT